jgi:hypothetical protein
MMMMKKKR